MAQRYIYDSLYGPIFIDDPVIWNIIISPELQRLREVRLCNINSLCLPGGANINRFEHAIGTYRLACETLSHWPALNPIYDEERRNFLIAALLHDVVSSAFGHSLEYIESKEGFDHEEAFRYVIAGIDNDEYNYEIATIEPIFFGLPRSLIRIIKQTDIEQISNYIMGKGKFGTVLNNTMDLDNIDNVYRMAYHIGLIHSGEVPLTIAGSLWVDRGQLRIKKDAIKFVDDWYALRRRLYQFLLLNPEEFSAKCMLTDAIEYSKRTLIHPFNWYDVDFELVQKLYNTYMSKNKYDTINISYSFEISQIISRLMTGNLYGCLAIYSTETIEIHNKIMDFAQKLCLEEAINNHFIGFKEQLGIPSRFDYSQVALHSIYDVNKTQRQIKIITEDDNEIVIGDNLQRVLLGVFFKNINLNIISLDNVPQSTLEKIREEIRLLLIEILNDDSISSIELHGEINEC